MKQIYAGNDPEIQTLKVGDYIQEGDRVGIITGERQEPEDRPVDLGAAIEYFETEEHDREQPYAINWGPNFKAIMDAAKRYNRIQEQAAILDAELEGRK